MGLVVIYLAVEAGLGCSLIVVSPGEHWDFLACVVVHKAHPERQADILWDCK